ncbi:uncharacterized protein C8A04DRAFT_11220 [Dichotomopilus funicola]|uniref:Peptidase S8/S53 domain-containing protein n=1 Tax=Dichotomopilus funicola TaxID=1934379 RepID=A0AAN6ZNV4_9PEZI|nr:hypothetical protein C8A04DRAFT_11220 [Dichotomopilus funicola]
MRHTTECEQSRLLRDLGALVNQRKAHIASRRSPTPPPDTRSSAEVFFEFELRRLFFCLGNFPKLFRGLSDDEFRESDLGPKALCDLLERLIDPRLPLKTEPGSLAPGDHPRLLALAELLRESTESYHLATRSDLSLFQAPDNKAESDRDLEQLTERNAFFNRLLPPSAQETEASPTAKSNSERADSPAEKSWGDLDLRDRATTTLSALVNRLECRRSHAIMLKLSEEAHRTISTELNLRLSACRDKCGWLDLQCSFTESRWTASMAVVKDLCADLGRNIGQGKALVVMIKQDGLFGAWTKSQTSSRAMPMETLDQLILNGAFQSMSPRMLFSGCGRRYKPHEKRALAVRLGYCLMDFFDRDLSSNRISLLSGTSSQSRSDTLYLSFDSDWPVLAERTNFRAGHPALLSFAKLLLEIEFGDAIPYEISHHEHKTNLATWAELFEMVGMLEEEHCGSYLAAVSGCLLVHRQISEALRLIGTDGKAAEAAIRKSLYTEIVCKLEAGVKESTPPSRMKRQRSISPEPATQQRKSKTRVIAGRQGLVSSGQYHSGLASTPVAITVGEPRPIPRYQRRTASSSTSGGQFDDDTPGDYSADICRFADSFINTHRDLYDELIEDPTTVPRVKVAVLDTSLDEGHTYIRRNKSRIREVRSWLPHRDESTGGDLCGHGTHVTNLLLDVAPDCDVYFAQVAAQVADPVPPPPRRIAEVIDHAVVEWQVDVISISFGFRDETRQGCDELRAAVIRAQAAGVLLFAAASNIGAYGIPAFPARQSGVFCIYAGDGKGNSSRTCPTVRNNDVNFLTLGEGVNSAWPQYKPHGSSHYVRTKRKSGTSFATPIAAGVAATFLLYARQNLTAQEAKRFKEYDKMKDLLARNAHTRHGYHVLSLDMFYKRTPGERKLLMRNIIEGREW